MINTSQSINPLLVSGIEAINALYCAVNANVNNDGLILATPSSTVEKVLINIRSRVPAWVLVANGVSPSTIWCFADPNYSDPLARAAFNYYLSNESTLIRGTSGNYATDMVNASTILGFDHLMRTINDHAHLVVDKPIEKVKENLDKLSQRQKHIMVFEYLLHQTDDTLLKGWKNVEAKS